MSTYKIAPSGDTAQLRRELVKILGPIASRFANIEQTLYGSPNTALVAPTPPSQGNSSSPPAPTTPPNSPSGSGGTAVDSAMVFRGPVSFEGEVNIAQQATAPTHPVTLANLPDPFSQSSEQLGNPLNVSANIYTGTGIAIVANTLTTVLTVQTMVEPMGSSTLHGGTGILFFNGPYHAFFVGANIYTNLATGSVLRIRIFDSGSPFIVGQQITISADPLSWTGLFMFNSTNSNAYSDTFSLAISATSGFNFNADSTLLVTQLF